nr:arsenic efflux protein [Clostridia bacterium]
MEHFVEILLHAVKDTLPLLPWILILYVIIQLVENKVDMRKVNDLGGKLGPVVGAATGLIPQCGFSVMAAKFFERKYITVGTLLAIFMATSDEAFILMLGSGKGAVWVLPMLAVKIIVGIAVGYAADGVMKLAGRGQVRMEMPKTFDKQPETVHEYFIQQYLEEREVNANCSCGREHSGDNPWKNYLLYPFLHALRVAAFIFLVNFVLTAVIHSVGEDKFASFMNGSRFLQPFVACAIGLIPNCASSVVLTETFLSGAITFGTCAAGLCANAGMGFVVLLRNTRKWKRNLLLVGVCYAVSVLVGIVLNFFPLLA